MTKESPTYNIVDTEIKLREDGKKFFAAMQILEALGKQLDSQILIIEATLETERIKPEFIPDLSAKACELAKKLEVQFIEFLRNYQLYFEDAAEATPDFPTPEITQDTFLDILDEYSEELAFNLEDLKGLIKPLFRQSHNFLEKKKEFLKLSQETLQAIQIINTILLTWRAQAVTKN